MWLMWASLRVAHGKGPALVPFPARLPCSVCSSYTGFLALSLNESTFLLQGLCVSLVCCFPWYVSATKQNFFGLFAVSSLVPRTATSS